jgi:hypothetical protein
LVVDADAVPSRPISTKSLQAVSGRNAQVVEARGRVKNAQLSQSGSLKVRRPSSDRLPIEQPRRITIPEGPNHRGSVLLLDDNGMRY